MAQYTAKQVLDCVWNNSGDEDSSDGSDFEESFSSGDESVGSSDEESDVEELDNNDGLDAGGDGSNNVRERQRRPRQNQPALVWRMATDNLPRDFPFTGNSGVQVPTAGFEPIDYFALFINDDLLNCFVTETNRYADDFIDSTDLRRNSRANDWKDTDLNEMKQFLGLLFLMGIIHKPSLDMYWSKDPIYSTPLFSAIMREIVFNLSSSSCTSMIIPKCLLLMIHHQINYSS